MIRTMYPQGRAQTATRPVGSCAGRRSERVIHTSAKVSLHAVSNAEIKRNIMKNNARSNQNSFQIGPWCVLGAFRGSKVTQKLPKALKRVPQNAQGRPWGDPGAPQERPRRPKERSKRAPERPREASGEAKSSKSGSPKRIRSISAKVLRESALPMRGALWTP